MDHNALQKLANELKHVFAPIEAQAEHVACIALDLLVARVAELGETIVHHDASPVLPLDIEGLLPTELKPLWDAVLRKLAAPSRGCIDCINLSGSQLRDLLASKAGPFVRVSSYVTDDVEYPLSIDTLVTLCSVRAPEPV